MGKYVLVGIILAAFQCVVSLPQHKRYPGSHNHRDKADKRTSVGDADGGKVVWGGNCSPRLTVFYSTQDLILECEVYAPTGTVFTWYKGTTPYKAHRQEEKVEEATNEIEWNEPLPLPNLNLASTVHISTFLYVDCASANDTGEYMLAVKTPGGRTQKRYFTLDFVAPNEDSMPGGTCRFGRELVSYIPRVYLYAKQVLAHRGYDVIVPCRSQGQDTTLEWNMENKPIGTSAKYQVLASGDLVIRDVTQKDRGVYSCRTFSNIAPSLTDEVFTYFFPHPQNHD